MPAEGVVGGLLMLIGGVMLITPGVLTDATGLLLLLPPTRRWIAERWVRPWLTRRIDQGTFRVVDMAGAAGPFDGGAVGHDVAAGDWGSADWGPADWAAATHREVLDGQRSLGRGDGGRVIDADFEVSDVDDADDSR
jgi:UPF0716 family protein affecting phage T7 exclusion